MENIFSGTSNEESLIELRAVVILISDPLGSEDNRKIIQIRLKYLMIFLLLVRMMRERKSGFCL